MGSLQKGVVVADRFRLERELGRGGMGAVWRAQHLALDTPCAIKFIHDQRIEDEISRERFRSEARAAARLRSTHVVQVFDYGIWESTPYIAMELLEGEDLSERLQREGRLSAEESVIIAAQVARALTHAARSGIVHRDLKPGNIFLARDAEVEIVKVLDFGVAKLPHGERQSTTTRTGTVVGTPNYLSPEQAHGAKSVDHRSDLYALGLIVFECVTGELAFEAEGLGALLGLIMGGNLPVPSERCPGLPTAFDDWFAKAASHDPAARFASADSMVDALRQALGAASPSTPKLLRRDRALTETLPHDRGAERHPGGVKQQEVSFCRSVDGVRLAYARLGNGPPLVNVAHWLGHLELDWGSPMWRHWLEFLGEDRTLIRYDLRGCGLSQREVEHLDFEAFLADLECVMDAAGVGQAPLLGLSQGASVAAAFAARHPERVSGLVLLGGYARGWRSGGKPRVKEHFDALMTLMRTGWGQNNPAFRQIFSSAFFPDGSAEDIDYLNELQRQTAAPELAARILSTLGDLDVREELTRVRCPTLVMHARGDQIAPYKNGMDLAASIPGARFVPLDSRNHVLTADEPAWEHFCDEMRGFLSSTPC